MAMDFPAMIESAAATHKPTHIVDMGPTEASIASRLLARSGHRFKIVSAVASGGGKPESSAGIVGSLATLLPRILALAAEALGLPDLSSETPLAQVGVTSQRLGMLRSRLLASVPGAAGRLPATSFFACPTVAAIAGLLAETEAAVEAGAQALPPITHISVYDNRGTTYPLSFGQEQMLRLQTMHPECTAYNVSSSVWIAGGASPRKVQSCIQHIIGRHELFSSVVVTSPPGLQLLSVRPSVSIVQVPDEAAALSRMGEVGRTPFKLSEEASIRAEIAVVPDGLLLVILWVHHINFDILSQGCFHRELHALLSSPSPSAARLPELTVQYVDFSKWSRDCVSQHLIDAGPMLEMLAPHTALALDLPLDKPRPKKWTFKADRITTRLPFDLELPHQGITPFVAHLTAFFIQLWKNSGQETVVVGVPYHGRDFASVEPLCGYFINMICVVGQATARTTVATALSQVRERWQKAVEHSGVPFLHLIDSLSAQNSARFEPSRNPVFQAMLNYRAESTRPLQDSRFRVQPVHQLEGHVDFDVQVDRVNGGTLITHNYCTDLFEPRTAERFAAQYMAALRAITLEEWKDIQTWRIPSAPRLLQDIQEATSVSLEYSARKLMPLLAEIRRPVLVGGPLGLQVLP